MNIIILGMPMSGKTTIGKIVAEKLHFTFCDTDELIGEKNNISISKIIEQYGEEYFRQYEQELIRDYMSTDSLVISIGGGAVNMKTIEMIKKYRYRVWLKCPIERLVSRYKPNKQTRPLLYNTTNIKRDLKFSLSERMPFYSECANIVINSYNSPPHDLADEVLLNIHEKN